VIGGSAIVLSTAGTPAAPFVAVGGLIYGGFMLSGGQDLIITLILERPLLTF